ncbi:MAG: formylglycine-generating enzyme family protein [Candidatus Delongbacteria bacterium]|nr:formylglycine-generating enzyme family protein [Candidatus Delongbacteria bacterium]MCG2760445.1 formylglycine-generating enzyme family protein [Candidatus Delongbacteria bacterium]
MICKKCNTLNSNDAKVCVNCGQKLGVVMPSKIEKKSGTDKPSTSRFNATPKQAQSKQNVPGSKPKKSKLGILLILLLVVVAGGGYILVNTEAGEQYIEDAKKNEFIGVYVTLVDSLLKANLSEYIPRMKAEGEAKKKRAEEEAKKQAEDEAKKKKVVKRAETEEDQKQIIKRVKRNMQYYKALKDNMNMVLIPAGPVKIGSYLESDNEKPIYEVQIKEFYIDEHEVSNSQFRIFVEETGYKLPKYILFDRFNGPQQPIVGVSYEDAEAYAKWAGKRLPTEYEWEKAARGGLEDLRYPFSNDLKPKMACYDLNPESDGPADVKSYEANDYKLYDIDGNVSEWTSSLAVPYPGGKMITVYNQEYRVIRGGSWKDIKSGLTVSRRDFKGKKWYSNGVGFRCVMDY